MNFNLLIVRDPVIFFPTWRARTGGGLEAGSDLSQGLHSGNSTVLFISNPRVGFQFLPTAIELCFNTLL